MCAYEVKRLQEPNRSFLRKKLQRFCGIGWRAITPITESLMKDVNDSNNSCIIYWTDITNEPHDKLSI